MYYNGQTLQHKETGKLVKLATKEDTTFAWDISEKTALFDEDGNPFVDDIENYTHIENELGQPVGGRFIKDRPDLSLKKYVRVDLEALRESTLMVWELKLLAEMAKSNFIDHPFANGSHCYLFEKFFLKNRNALPLYRQWDWAEKHKELTPRNSWNVSVWKDGPLTFIHNSQRWLYTAGVMKNLFVISDLLKSE